MKNIVANNPVSFLSEFTNAIRDGWTLDNKRFALVLQPTLVECTLVKQKDDLPQLVEFKPNATELVIEAPSFAELCEKLQFFVYKHWELDYSTLNANLAGMSSVRVWREKHLAVQNYTKEELYDMEWEKLKMLGRSYNCFNRNKDICIFNILKQQEGK
jgi:hypothetical protein